MKAYLLRLRKCNMPQGETLLIFLVCQFSALQSFQHGMPRGHCLLGPLNGHPAQSRLRIIQPADACGALNREEP